MDCNYEAILEKLLSTGFNIETLGIDFDSNSLIEILEGVDIKLTKKNFNSFKNYMCKHKDILDYIFQLEFSSY